MKFTMRGPIRDLLSFGKHLRQRNRIFATAEKTPLPVGNMNILAARLHPREQRLSVASVREEYPGTFTYRLVPAGTALSETGTALSETGTALSETGGSSGTTRVAPFRAGQYIAIEATVRGNRVSRPYSICCSPDDSRRGNYYDITIKQKPDGYVALPGTDTWKPGATLVCSEPEGHFSVEPLRDSKKLICIAGGTGITPFRSIIPDTLEHDPDARIFLFYGVNTRTELLYVEDFDALRNRYPGRFRMTVVCAGTAGAEQAAGADPSGAQAALPGKMAPPAAGADPSGAGATHLAGNAPDCERGFITADLIARIAGTSDDPTVFICGPEAMQDHLSAELDPFALPHRRIRRENFGTVNTHRGEIVHGAAIGAQAAPIAGNAPAGVAPATLTITVCDRSGTTRIPASPDETILVAMERAGMNPPARCRSGECGWCRSRLTAGTVRVSDRNDGRRAADRKFSFIHPCASYPVTDIELGVEKNPLGRSPL